MTKTTRAYATSSKSTIGSEFPPTVDAASIPASPRTERAELIQWDVCFRPQDIPVPPDFEDIDSAVSDFERNIERRERLSAARRRLAKRLRGPMTLATLRMRRGWSQKQLAEAIGTSQPHIARIENGRDNVLLATANQLAKALGVTLDEINRCLGFGSGHI